MNSADLAILVLGFFLLFLGWNFYRLGLKVFGGFVGGCVGVLLARMVFEALENHRLAPFAAVAAGFLFAFIGYFIFQKIYRLALFLVCSLFGYQLNSLWGISDRLIEYLPTNWHQWLDNGVGALVVAFMIGLVGMALQRYLVIALTSLAGAGLASEALDRISELVEKDSLMVPLFIVGVLAQLFLVRQLRLDTNIKKEEFADD